MDHNATQGQNSSPAEQLTINLNQQSNYELILNLLNSSAASPTQKLQQCAECERIVLRIYSAEIVLLP